MASYAQEIFKSENLIVQGIENKQVLIIKTSWNQAVIEKLYKGALTVLLEAGVKDEHIKTIEVPGAFELPYAASAGLDRIPGLSAVVALGCIIKGETPHFDFIAQAVANGLMTVQLNKQIPVAFGVLTTNTEEQAQERAGGRHGNKGAEAALTVLQMLALKYYESL